MSETPDPRLAVTMRGAAPRGDLIRVGPRSEEETGAPPEEETPYPPPPEEDVAEEGESAETPA
jgi:hypothetical protein